MKNYLASSAFILATAFSASVNAALVVNVQNTIEGTVTDSSNIIGTIEGYYGALFLSNTEATELTFEFVGSDAKWDNSLTIRKNGEGEEAPNEYTIKNHPNDEVGPILILADDSNRQTQTIQYAAGEVLDFYFTINHPRNGVVTFNNEDNKLPVIFDPVNGSNQSFFVAFELDAEGAIVSLLLGLDDGGSTSGPADLDFNDLVIRISGFSDIELQEVPVPASLPLFISALTTGVVLAKRRNRNKA